MNAVPLSIECMALIAAARRNSRREDILSGAIALLNDSETDRIVLSAHLNRLLELKLFRLEDNELHVTKRGTVSLANTANRIRRLEAACW